MTTLTTFLMDRIAEDMKAARDCKQWGECFVCETHERYDTDRILAECEAKLRVLDLARSTDAAEIHTDAWTVAKWAVRCLALPYANHPDYRKEWRA